VARTTRGRTTGTTGRRLRLCAGPALAALLGLAAAPGAEAAAGPSGTAANTPQIRALPSGGGSAATGALADAYATGRHLPTSAVGAPRAGSVHLAEDTATGVSWAVADFVPSPGASAADALAFQDGAGKALFAEKPGASWTWQGSATRAACTDSGSIPAAALSLLDLPAPGSGSCEAGTARPSAEQRAALAHPDSVGSSIASVALGQVGVATTPAETGFGGVDCDPYSTLVGAASPNSDGCGADPTHSVADENEEWCSDFSKWAWEQGGVTANLNDLNAGANSFYAWAVAEGESPAAGSGTPEPGDAVVFYPAGTITSSSYADHVGLITSVNSNGTVDMVNGDFLGSSGITVEYDTDLNLTSWAGSTWSSGEQWVLVTPPSAAQSAAPSLSVSAPATAAAGTDVPFTASAAESGGTISQYAWTFGDGRDADAAGASVGHVFSRAGLYTVTVSATSNLGTVTTKTWNVGVSAPSAGVSTVPNTSVWYTTAPEMQYEFTENSANALAVDSWDGAAWLQQAEPGSLASGSGLTSLAFADPAVTDAPIPHAYYRTSGGTLGETYPGTSGWTSATLAGSPAAGSAIAAVAADPQPGGTAAAGVTPSVFYFDSASGLEVSAPQSPAAGATWTASAIQGPTTSAPRSLSTATSGSAAYVFYLDNAGDVIAATDASGSWQTAPIPNSLGLTAGTALSADTTGTGIDVYFLDAAGDLAVATFATGSGTWQTTQLPGSPAAGTTLAATNTLTSSGAVVDEVFYLASSGGAPAVTWWTGSAWQSATLPGTATGIAAVSGNDVPGAVQQLFLTDGATPSLDSSSAPGASWTAAALPSTPTAYPGTVLLYAATSADDTTALNAASYAKLPSSQVTTDFATAWAATLSGNYLVVTVGQAAYNALFDNPCGWANPSQDDPGTTPFNYVVRPLNVTLTNLFLVGEAATASDSQARTDDLAYYAVHGALPAGATIPTIANPGYTCLGSAG
jgi:hypothetical protein